MDDAMTDIAAKDEGFVETVDRAAEEARSPFYSRAQAHNLAPLWRVLGGLVTEEPKSPAVPAHWAYADVRPYLMEACDIISTEEAERRVLVFENPGLPGRSRITPSLFAGYNPNHSQGDRLSDVTGVMSYSFNSYELLVTEAVTVVADVTLGREATTLRGGRDHLTIASYNVENLDPGDGPVKYKLLADDIVYSLGAPDIIGLQEIQDANGLNGSDPLSGIVTAQLLIDAIAAIGGPNSGYIEIAPSSANSTGGEPGGNIRNGFLFNADRVSYVEGSAVLIDDPAFACSRRPLVAEFLFNGQKVTLINVHFTSRIGSDPLWGSTQPPADAGDGARTAQAQAVSAYVNNALATNPALHFGVLGDFNGFYFEDGVGALERTSVNDYDVVVLDRDLPVVHGDDVCRSLTRDGGAVRVLMLTAANEIEDRVDGLHLGADDYLAKPFAFVELVARVRALGRRTAPAVPPVLERHGIRLDPARREVTRDGRWIRLSGKEFGVLEQLMRADGTLVSAEQLLEKVWDEHTDPFTNVVRVTVMTLRRKLGPPSLVQTVTGAGYRLP